MNRILIAFVSLAALVPISAMADTWGDQVDPSFRFTLLPGYQFAAVLDNETGLVWEQSPNTASRNWGAALVWCNQLNVYNRKGWRLPTLQELASLVDASQTFPALPAGHPFSNVLNVGYFTATTVTGFGDLAWFVAFDGGFTGHIGKSAPNVHVWCVRGGQGVDVQ